MATFAPDVQTVQDPIYFHWSRPIDQPKADISKGIMLKTLGEVTKDTLNVGDELIKQNLDRNIHKDVDAIQGEYINALQGKYSQDARQPGQTDVNGLPVTQDTLTGKSNEPQTPAQLKDLNQSIDILGNARANNKLSKTAYDMRMDALAKDYRARYPGWRDSIDESFQRANSLRSTANQYISSLLGDINSFQENLKAQRSKTETLLTEHFGEIPNAPILHQALKDGSMSPLEVEQRMYPYIAEKAQFEARKRQLEDYKNNKDFQALQAKDIFGKHTVNAAQQFLDGFEVAVDNGLKNSGRSEKFTDMMQNWANGVEKPTDLQFQQWGDQLAIQKQALHDKLLKEASVVPEATKDNPNPKSLLDYMGGSQEFEKQFEENTAILTRYIDAIRNKDTGAMYSNKNANRAIADDTLNVALRDPGTGGYIAMMDAFKGASPAFFQTFENSALMKRLGHPDDTFFETLAARAITQQDRRLHGQGAPTNPTGQAFTMGDAVKIATDPSVSSSLRDPNGLVKNAISLADNIGNKDVDDTVKEGLATYAFDPKNAGFLSMFSKDGDKYSTFSKLTNPNNTKELYRLGQSNPEIWKNYKNWAETSFARYLYSTELNNITDYKDVPGVEIHYNDQTHAFNAALSPPPTDAKLPADYFARARVAQQKIQERLNFLNQGISSMVNIAKTEGNPNPDAYVYQLINLVNPKALLPAQNDVASKFSTAIQSTTKPLQYQNEQGGNQQGSLRSFLNNPGGSADRRANFMHGQFGPPGSNIVSVNTLAGNVHLNAESAPHLQGFINDLVQAGAPVQRIGGYNYRNIRGTNTLSQHAYGNAIDIDQISRDNAPALRRWADANPTKFREILSRNNIVSGGDWRNPDFGHFEWGGH